MGEREGEGVILIFKPLNHLSRIAKYIIKLYKTGLMPELNNIFVSALWQATVSYRRNEYTQLY